LWDILPSDHSAGDAVGGRLRFSQYRTFDWGLPDTLPIGDPRLDRDPFFRETAQRGDLVLKR
jgi:hypothetical protein